LQAPLIYSAARGQGLYIKIARDPLVRVRA
jgi:hypothetical protein